LLADQRNGLTFNNGHNKTSGGFGIQTGYRGSLGRQYSNDGLIEPVTYTNARSPDEFRQKLGEKLSVQFPPVEDDGSPWGFQPVVLNRIAQALNQYRKLLVSSPTGTGKTNMMNRLLEVAGDICHPHEIVIVINHSVAGLEQFLNIHTLARNQKKGIRFYTLKEPLSGGGRPIFTTYNTFPKLAKLLRNHGYQVSLVLEDEAHHRLHRYRAVTKALDLFPQAVDIQWTATPSSSTTHLKNMGYHTVFDMNVNEAIARKTLCPVRIERRVTQLTP
jgi:superfamily II DNA or RNA helicase